MLFARAPGVGRDAAQLVGDLRLAAPGSAINAGSPKIVRQARATGQRRSLITEACVGISLIEETEDNVFLASLRIDCLGAIEVPQRPFVFAQMPMNQAARK